MLFKLNSDRPPGGAIGVGMVFGVAFGFAFGAAIDNLAAGIGAGVGIGVALGLMLDKRWPNGDADAIGRSASGPEVAFDEEGVSISYESGEYKRIFWNELNKVGVSTTDEGPQQDDVFIGLHGAGDNIIVYPSGARGSDALLGELQKRLAGFDNETFVIAMGLTSNAHFVIWERAQT
jgi:hypothetical protein